MCPFELWDPCGPDESFEKWNSTQVFGVHTDPASSHLCHSWTLCVLNVSGALIISALWSTQTVKFRILGLKGPRLLHFLLYFFLAPPHAVCYHGNHSLTPVSLSLSLSLSITLKTFRWPTFPRLEALYLYLTLHSRPSVGPTACSTALLPSSADCTICSLVLLHMFLTMECTIWELIRGCAVIWCTTWTKHMGIPIVEKTDWECLCVGVQCVVCHVSQPSHGKNLWLYDQLISHISEDKHIM